VIFGGGFVYFIGSLYTIFFGLLVVVVEVKDKTAPVSAAYDWLHVYLKFLTFQVSHHTNMHSIASCARASVHPPR